jgi:hypothetical protein
MRSATRPAARQRPRPDAENFGGEVSFEPPSRFTSLDHLVGEQLDRIGYLDAECSRGLHVDDELELGRLQDREVGPAQGRADPPVGPCELR